MLKYQSKIWLEMRITILLLLNQKPFSGKSKIEQHKLVYNALRGKMGNELHAL